MNMNHFLTYVLKNTRRNHVLFAPIISESRIREWLRSGVTSGVYLVQPEAGCVGPCPDGFWLTPRMETPPPFWATFLIVPVLDHHHSEYVFPDVQIEHPVFQIVPSVSWGIMKD